MLKYIYGTSNCLAEIPQHILESHTIECITDYDMDLDGNGWIECGLYSESESESERPSH